MARAVCDACRVEVPWSASRGSSLADLSCPICRGRLRPALHEEVLTQVRSVAPAKVCLWYPHDWPEPEMRGATRWVPRDLAGRSTLADP